MMKQRGDMDSSLESSVPLIRSRYQVISTLGSGGLGTVYYGWDQELERPVAIKRLFPQSQRQINLREESWREARTMAAIQHANIVTLFDFGEDEDGPFFIMEYIDGFTLDKLTAADHPPDEESILEVTRQSLKGLCAAHEKGIIHRDLKAGNIMVTTSAGGELTAKILDFGLARFQQAPTEQTILDDGSFMGSVYYTSPEQLNHAPLDDRTDLYSLGHVIYHYASGYTAFKGETIQQLIASHLTKDPPDVLEIRDDLNPSFAQWLAWLMQREPENRPDSSSDALRSLKEITNHIVAIQTGQLPLPQGTPTEPLDVFQSAPPPVEPVEAPPARPTFTIANPPPKQNSVPWFWIGVGSITLGLAGILVWMMVQPEPVPRPPALSGATATTPNFTDKPTTPPPPHRPAGTGREFPLESASEPLAASPDPASNSSRAGTSIVDPTDLPALSGQLGQTITIEGTPVQLSENRSQTAFYLNFTPDYRDSVALVMFLSNDPDGFTRQRLEPFVGQKIRVTGVLDQYRGNYQIKLNSRREIQPQ